MKILIFISLIISSLNCDVEKYQLFAEEYVPSNIVGSDTLAVARLPELDKLFIECIQSNFEDNKTVQEATLLIFMKLYYNHRVKHGRSYDYCYSYRSCLVQKTMELTKFDKELECFDFNDHYVYLWVKKHKKRYKMPLLSKYIEKIDKTLKE